ncbi:unnamed protein product [Caenorhabditis sp. 36 PRJEB53466]|nr:unnamed protein product [Caenorhabditis sp. 36 PRJEB53466]
MPRSSKFTRVPESVFALVCATSWKGFEGTAFGNCIHEHSQAEQQLNKLLRSGIEGCSRVVVHDVSNGCGSMYEVFVEATSFKGLSKVAQHKMITSLLREEIKDMHGLTIRTKAA